MQKKNKKNELVTVHCNNKGCKEEAIEEFNLDCEEEGIAYFCSPHCQLNFALEFDFDEEADEILAEICISRRIYQNNEVMRETIKEITSLMSLDTGRKVMQNLYLKELDALKNSLQL